MSGTRHTARGNPIYVQANAASRHAVSICQSTWFYCPLQWLLTKSYLSFSIPFASLSLSSSLLFFVICTQNRAELLQYGSGSGGGSVCRQQKISNKSFRNPASLLSASPDFHYSLLCHLRILPKLFLFPLASPYRPVKRENYYIVSIFLPLVVFSRLALSYFYLFFLLLPPRFSLHFDKPARSFRFSFFFAFFSFIYHPLYRVISVQVSALIAFVSYAFPAWTSIATSSLFRRTVITISGAAGYDWKRDSSEFRNYVRHSRERQPELVVMPNGERDKEIYWSSANKEIF